MWSRRSLRPLHHPDRDFQVREVELSEVVRAALRRNARTLIDARVTPELGELGLTVSADPKWVEFMLGQPMGNAAKYRREGAEAPAPVGRAPADGHDAWETLLFVEDDAWASLLRTWGAS